MSTKIWIMGKDYQKATKSSHREIKYSLKRYKNEQKNSYVEYKFIKMENYELK